MLSCNCHASPVAFATLSPTITRSNELPILTNFPSFNGDRPTIPPTFYSIFFIIGRINSPPVVPLNHTRSTFPSYSPTLLDRSRRVSSRRSKISSPSIYPRFFVIRDETISKLNEISKARSKVYEQGDRGNDKRYTHSEIGNSISI